MSRVLCRRVSSSSHSLVSHFSVDDLEQALCEDLPPQEVYAGVCGAGRVVCASGAAVARVCVSARLAPSALVATGRLVWARGALSLHVFLDEGELLLWLDEAALGALDMPVLAPHHFRAHYYQCHVCTERFPDPNPLKLHLFLQCARPDAHSFWHEAATRLRTAPAPAPAPLSPAQLEVLAAAWGRRSDGVGHACLYCGKLYSRRYGLRIHLRTHTGHRPLRCPHCRRAFADPSNLNKHVRLHRARTQTNLPLPQQIKQAPCV